MDNNIPMTFSSKVSLRFDGETGHCFVWTPYNAGFVAELKDTFNNPRNGGVSMAEGDPGAEWEPILMCWIIHTGWLGCEDWLDKLICLLNKYYPE